MAVWAGHGSLCEFLRRSIWLLYRTEVPTLHATLSLDARTLTTLNLTLILTLILAVILTVTLGFLTGQRCCNFGTPVVDHSPKCVGLESTVRPPEQQLIYASDSCQIT